MTTVVNSGPDGTRGINILLGLQRLPALISFYTAGKAALQRHRYAILSSLAVDVVHREPDQRTPLIAALHVGRVFSGAPFPQMLAAEAHEHRELTAEELTAILEGRNQKRYTPESDLLHDRLP
jgi:hypothetical protein